LERANPERYRLIFSVLPEAINQAWCTYRPLEEFECLLQLMVSECREAVRAYRELLETQSRRP
jgi:hypothetical protein